MTRKTIAIMVLLLALLSSIVGTAAADTIDEPPVDPVAEETGTKFFTHPVVQLLSAYFDRDWQPEEEVTPDPEGELEEGETPEGETPEGEDGGEESGLGPIGEQIAAYHEEGMGFGVLVKIYAMAEAAKGACPETVDPAAEPCVPVTAEELVESFRSGAGMGELFQEYGKPALLGVGHVKKELKNLPVEEEPVVVEPGEEELPALMDVQGGKPEKVKEDKGKPETGKPVTPARDKSNNGKGGKK